MRRIGIAFLAVVLGCIIAIPVSVAQNWETAVVVTTDKAHENQGGSETNGNNFIIKAGGDDIWGNADQFTFVYQEISGDFEMTVTVHSLEKTNDWSKSGVMIRQNLEPGSINAFAACRGLDDLITFQRRETPDGGSDSERLTPENARRPVTIKLIRTGDTITGGWSLDDGKTWEDPVTRDGVTPTPPINLTFSDPVLLGIAVTSHEEGVITTSEVEVIDAPNFFPVEPSDKTASVWGKIKSRY